MANNTDNYTSKFRVDISDLKKGIAEANNIIKKANAEFRNATAGTDDWSKSADGLSAKIQQQQSIVEAEKKKLALLKEELARLEQNQEQGKSIIAELTVKHQQAVEMYGKESEEAKKYAKQLTDAESAQERNATAAEQLRLRIINQDTAVKNAESRVSRYESALSDLQSQTGSLNEIVKKQQSELDSLKQKYVDVSTAQGKDSNEAKALAQQIESLSSELKDNKSKLEDARKSADELDKSIDNLDEQSGTLTDTVKKQQSELDELKQKYINVASSQGKDSEEAKELAGQIQSLSGELRENRDKLSDAEQAADILDDSLEDVGDSANETTTGGLNAFAVALGNLASNVISGLIDKLKELIKQTGQVGMSFDSSISQVASTFGYTVDELADSTSEMSKNMDALKDFSKEIGANTKFSMTQAAEGMNFAAMAGWKAEEILEGYQGIVDLAASSNEDLATTADIVTDGLTAMGYGAEDASHFADVMAKTASNANTNVTIMGESLKYAGTTAGLFGEEADGTNRKIENLALGLGLMANSGIKGSQAGNNLKNALVNLIKPTNAQAIAMEKLGLATTEMQKVLDPEEIEKAEKALNKASEALQNSATNVSNKILDAENKQIAYNNAVAKYGESSSQAQQALNNLEKEQNKLADAQSKYAELQNDLTNAQNALTIAQEGTYEAVATGETAFANADGSLKSLKEIYDALRSSMSTVGDAIKKNNIDLADSEGNARDLDDILNDLSDTEANLTEVEQLKNAAIVFGKQNMAGMLAIINASEEDYNSLADAIYNSEGAAAKAAETMQDNLGGDLTTIKSKIEAFEYALYEKFEPTLRKIADTIMTLLTNAITKTDELQPTFDKIASGFETAFNWIVEHGAEIISTLSGIVAGIVAFKAVTAVQKAIDVFKAFFAVIANEGIKAALLTVFTNPIGLAIAAIAGLVTAFIVLWQRSEKFRNFWIGLWNSIQETCFKFFDAFVAGWNGLKSFLSDVWDSIQETVYSYLDGIINAWSGLKSFFVGLWDSIQETVYSYLDGIINAWNGLKSLFVGLWKSIQETVQNGIERVITFFSGLWKGIQNIFKGVSEWFNQNVFAPIIDFFQPVITFFAEAFAIINELSEGVVKLIQAVWGIVSTWFSITVIEPLKAAFVTFWSNLKQTASDTSEGIKTIWKSVNVWFSTTVIEPLKTAFVTFWENLKKVASDTLEGIKTIWKSVNVWFTTTVIEPLKSAFITFWDNLKQKASDTWEGIKNIWTIVQVWFTTTVIDPVKNAFSNAWDSLKRGASDAWEGIKSVFSHVADWFENTFSRAWQKVKDVFSAGGKVFDGIKDGIFNAFKAVVNTLIRGINTIIAIPFNAINNALDTIANIQILDFKPFEGLISRFTVPEIPQLAKGGIVNRPTLAEIGEDGTEAVIPLERNKAGLKMLARMLAEEIQLQTVAIAPSGGTVNNYTFNQTNNSPKALSRWELHRQAENMLRMTKKV